MNKRICSFFVGLCFIAVGLSSCGTGIPVAGFFGSTFPATTDSASNQLISYYDLRSRDSYVQVSNISNETVAIHVQIFQNNVPGCPELNFYDTLTGNDTHIYNLRDLQGNANPVNISLADDSNGFMVITHVESASQGSPSVLSSDLIGNFRIVDNTGYEYRSNSAGFPSAIFERFAELFQLAIASEGMEPPTDQEVRTFFLELIALIQRAQPRYTFNFNEIGGVNQSDIVGIGIANAGAIFDFEDILNEEEEIGSIGFPSVINIPANFVANVYNEAENPTSCDDVIFACGGDTEAPFLGGGPVLGEGDFLNQGINDVFPSTNGDQLICPGNNNPNGFVELLGTSPSPLLFVGGPEEELLEELGFSLFTGFVGLNNGNGRGSMDSMVGNNSTICPLLFPELSLEAIIEGDELPPVMGDGDGDIEEILDELTFGLCDPFGILSEFIGDGFNPLSIGLLPPELLLAIENMGLNPDSLVIEQQQ